MGSEPERIRRVSHRWFWYAVITQAITVAVYFGWHAGWDVFHGLTNGWSWVCLMMWQRLAGFARGWEAAERESTASRR